MIAKAPRKTPRKNRFAQVPQLQNFPWWATIQRIDLADKLTPYHPPPFSWKNQTWVFHVFPMVFPTKSIFHHKLFPFGPWVSVTVSVPSGRAPARDFQKNPRRFRETCQVVRFRLRCPNQTLNTLPLMAQTVDRWSKMIVFSNYSTM